MKKLEIIFELPINIACVVMGIWVTIAPVVRLNVAIRRYPEKEIQLAQLLGLKCFVVLNPVDVSLSRLISWLLDYEVKASNLVFRMLDLDAPNMSKYLQRYGSYVRTLSINANQADSTLVTIASFCKRLVKIELLNGAANTTIVDLLLSSRSSLQDVRLFKKIDIQMASEQSLAGLALRSRTSLAATDFAQGNGFPSLVHADLSLCRKSSPDLIFFLRNCPQLKALGLRYLLIHNFEYAQISLLRPTLLHIDISQNPSVTNEGIKSIVQILTHLRSLNYQKCRSTTSKSLRLVANHIGTTIETLYTDLLPAQSAELLQNLRYLGEKAVVLRTLNIYGHMADLCATGIAYVITRGFPSLRALVLNNAKLGLSCKQFMRDLRPDLRVSLDPHAPHYSIMNMAV